MKFSVDLISFHFRTAHVKVKFSREIKRVLLNIRDFVNFFLEQRATVSYGSYGELRLENTRLYIKSYGGGIYSLICYRSRATESYGELQRPMGTYG